MKKKKFITYKSNLDGLTQLGEKAGMKFPDSVLQIIRSYRMHQGINYTQTPDFMIHACESEYQKSRNMLFIESEETLEFLMNLKYKTDPKSNIPLPFDIFSVAVPNGLTYKGVPVHPFLIYAADKRTPQAGEDFLDLINYDIKRNHPEGAIEEANRKACRVNVFIPENPIVKDSPISSLTVTDEALVELLNLDITETERSREILGNNDRRLTEMEQQQQLLTLKLMAAIGIYNEATKGKHIRFGIPHGYQKPKELGMMKDEFKKISASSIGITRPSKGGSKGASVITGFMRNLVHQKYYQGVHANKPIGSRWVEVEGWVTGDTKPYTQEVGKNTNQ